MSQDSASPAPILSIPSLSQQYPRYYKDVSQYTEVDVYAVHHLFGISDPSGAIQHASKKLLLSGSRNGGKSQYQDIKEARDTLNRWLQLNSSLVPRTVE
ncbi:MAG: hypothetical protein E6R03_00300 [Hyphomicrobiaceae bacterium]|nr:MAG: hypothetical protein E6R03_00300 [Hyphomicrobiaceae bacterium]